jgi:hypothetical protein
MSTCRYLARLVTLESRKFPEQAYRSCLGILNLANPPKKNL